jgi:hypothetical protein
VLVLVEVDMGMEALNAVGKCVLKFFGWRERKQKEAQDDLEKAVLTDTDDNSLRHKFKRVFGK